MDYTKHMNEERIPPYRIIQVNMLFFFFLFILLTYIVYRNSDGVGIVHVYEEGLVGYTCNLIVVYWYEYGSGKQG